MQVLTSAYKIQDSALVLRTGSLRKPKYTLNTVCEKGVFQSYLYLRNYRCLKMTPTCKMHVKWIMFKFSLRSMATIVLRS